MIRIKHTATLGGSTFQRVAANELLLPGIYFPSLDQTTISRTTLGEPTGFSVTLDGTGLITDRSFLNGGTVEGMTVKASGSILGGTLTGMDMAATALQTVISAVQSSSGTIADLTEAVWGGERFNITGHGGKDVVEGGGKADKIATKGGNDLVIATAGKDTIDGGAARDRLTYEDISLPNGISVDLKAGTVKVGSKTQTIVGFEVLAATNQDDDLYGSSGADSIFGLHGEDIIEGRGGGDFLYGEDGDDFIHGNGGNDMLFGGGGRDNLIAGAGDDTMNGNGGADTIAAGAGDDIIDGANGSDRIDAGTGDDTVRGGNGADTIDGGGGDDRLNGGGGADTLRGNGGDDTLTGNGGADIFQFRASDRNDTINDFRQGQDKIQIQSGANSFDALDIQQDGRDVLIGFGAGQVRVVTDNVAAFDESDFIF